MSVRDKVQANYERVVAEVINGREQTEIEVNLFIAVPAFGGMHPDFVSSLIKLQHLFLTHNLHCQVCFIQGESLVTRARNRCVDKFMQSPCTHLMFIDADIQFNAEDVIDLIAFNKDIIGGAYPIKCINWELIKQAVLNNPDIDPYQLPKMGATFTTHPFTSDIAIAKNVPVAVKELATGFMLIKREVFEKLAPHVPHYAPFTEEHHLRETVYDYFQVGVYDNIYESEDYCFCRLWRSLGGEVYFCPWIQLTHHGNYGYPGDLFAAALRRKKPVDKPKDMCSPMAEEVGKYHD